MSKNVALFSGQGSQFVGMAEGLDDKKSEEIFEIGSKVTGFDLKKLCNESTMEELSKTNNSQLAIFAVSLCKLYKSEITFDACAGFSLGEFTALVCAGVLSIEDGFKIIKKRGELMMAESLKTSGKMAAVLGLSPNVIEEICEKSDAFVAPVNYNCPGQVVIAGEASGIDFVEGLLKEAGAKRVLPLAVSGAFHTKLMANAGQSLSEFVSSIKINEPTMPIYTNITGEKLENIDLAKHVYTHMTSPVRFETSVNNMLSDGFDTFYEIGCGKTLNGFLKKISKETPCEVL